MHKVVSVFALLACVGDSRRVQQASMTHEPSDKIDSLKAFAMLLGSLDPAAAFQPSAAAFQPSGPLASPVSTLAQPRAPLSAQMAGFGKPTEKKVEKAMPRKQWTVFSNLVKAGQPRNPVFARGKGDSDWTKVGEVACSADTDLAAAVELHKELILQHAVKVNFQLIPKKKRLELGYAADADTEPTVLEEGVVAAPLKKAGFEGEPDSTGRYQSVKSAEGETAAPPEKEQNPRAPAKGKSSLR